MGLSSRIVIGAAIVAAAGGGLLLEPFDIGDAHRDATGRPALIERADCRQSSPASSTALISAPTGLSQDITVTMPRTALIRVDAARSVRAAATNTGCAPRAGDDFFIIEADGSINATSADDFAEYHWDGDFTIPGEYVDQPVLTDACRGSRELWC